MKTVKFEATGFVFGNYWGGGRGAYPSRKLTANTKEELLEQANSGLDGSLDGGMGYESLLGALLDITTITTQIIDGKTFYHKENELEFIGDLTDDDEEFLIDCYYNS